MGILFVLGALLLALVCATWSMSRSYFEAGRSKGTDEAVRELLRGLSPHLEGDGGGLPAAVEQALAVLQALPRGCPRNATTDPHHAQLWVVGDSLGEACWLKGHAAGVRRKLPAEGKVRVDLTVNELLQLGWLSNLGFQYMMPNYRGFEIYRFGGQEDAQEAARAISRLDSAVPAKDRPFADPTVQLKNRNQLISDWWQVGPDRLSA